MPSLPRWYCEVLDVESSIVQPGKARFECTVGCYTVRAIGMHTQIQWIIASLPLARFDYKTFIQELL